MIFAAWGSSHKVSLRRWQTLPRQRLRRDVQSDGVSSDSPRQWSFTRLRRQRRGTRPRADTGTKSLLVTGDRKHDRGYKLVDTAAKKVAAYGTALYGGRG